MAKLEVNGKDVYDISQMAVSAYTRYWEDSKINGKSLPQNGLGCPCRNGDMWEPIIDVDTGLITNWDKGVEANIHFKVCDACSFTLSTKEGKDIYKVENEYVPNILSPKDYGYGDYIIMDIDKEGYIQKWDKEKLFLIDVYYHEYATVL